MKASKAQVVALVLVGVGLFLHGVAYWYQSFGDGYHYRSEGGELLRVEKSTGRRFVARGGKWTEY